MTNETGGSARRRIGRSKTIGTIRLIRSNPLNRSTNPEMPKIPEAPTPL